MLEVEVSFGEVQTMSVINWEEALEAVCAELGKSQCWQSW